MFFFGVFFISLTVPFWPRSAAASASIRFLSKLRLDFVFPSCHVSVSGIPAHRAVIP